MGGHALKKVKTFRKPKEEYFQIKNDILSKLDCKFGVVEELPEKEEFGDIDILINDSNIRSIIEKFNPTEIVKNGNVYSFDYGISEEPIQVDFIGVSNIEMAEFYFNYSDVGSILGRICNSVGLKIGHLGFWFHNEDIKVFLSENPQEICDFLGLNYIKWKEGFNSKKEIFEWIIECKYFRKDLFENLNHDHQKRANTRPMYIEFLKFIKDISQEKIVFENQQEYATKYFDKQEILDQKIEELNKKKILAKKFNGKMFIELGFSGKEIGIKMNEFKNSFSDFNEFLENTSKEDIFTKIKEFIVH